MRKVITTMLVASMILSMAMPTSAATITRKKSTSGTSSTTKVSGDYSLKMVDKTLQFIRGGKVVSSIETKDGKITLRKSSAGGISVVFTDANGKRRNITLGKQTSVKLSGTFTQVSVDKALGSSFDVEMEKGSKVTNFYAKGAAKVTLNGSVTTLNVTSSNANVAANGTVSRAYAVNKKAISGMPAGKITQTSTGTSASGSVNTTGSGSSSSSNTTVNNGSGSGNSSSSSGGSGIIINGGGSNNGGTNTVAAPKITQQPTSVEIEEGKSATLTIKATATGKISYQWYDAKTGKAIAGATSSSLKVSPKESTSYYCLVTNTVGSKKATIRSNTVTVTVKGQVVVVAAPVIKTHPASVTVEVGNEATLEVVVEPVTGLTPKYQWYTTNNDSTTPVNTPIKDATSAIYKVTPETAGAVSYYCSIINVNADGVESQPTTSETASITATAKVTDADLLKAKADIEALKDTEYADLDAVKAAITAAATANGVTADVTGLTLDGTKVSGNVILSKDKVEGTVTVPFTATVKEQPTENADLKAAKDAIEALNTNSYEDVTAAVAAIKAAVTNEKIDVNTDGVDLNEDGSRIVGDVILTITVDGKTETMTAKFDAAVAQAGDAQAPEFKDNLPTTALTVSLDNPVTLNVDAVVTDGGTVTYQWYRGISDNVDEGTELAGATGKSYILNEAGDYYYWVVATNTLPNGKTAKSVSNILEVSASYPANSAQVPNITTPLSGQTVDKDRPVTPLNATATVTDGGSLTYQWYKTSSEVASGGEEIPNATDATYTPSSATAGTSYYYCVVNNHNDAATGMTDVKATTNVAKIIVRHDVGFVAEDVAKNEAGDTSKIRLTFSEKIDNMSEFTAEDFEIKGKSHTTGETCTLKIDSIFKYISKDKIDLNISGVDKSEIAEIKVLKAPEGVTMSAPAQVQITQASAPTPAPGDLIEKFEPADGEADTADTTKVRVVFREVPASPPIIGDFELKASGGATLGTSPVEKVDDKTYLVPVKVTNDDKTEIVLTKAGTAIADTSKQPKTTIHKDTTKPTVLAAKIPADDRTQIRIECSEKLKTSSTASTTAFKLYSNAAATTEISNTISSVVYRDNYIEVNVQDPITSSLYVKFTPTASSAEIQDTSVAGNKMDTFTKMAIAESAPETLEITKVETLQPVTDDDGNTGVKEAYMSLNTVVKNSDPSDSDGKKLAKSFTVKASDGNDYTVVAATIEKAVPRSIKTGSVLKLEFSPLIPENVTIEVAYTPSKETGAAQLADITTGTVIEQEASAGTDAVKPIESAIKVVSASPAGLTSAPADYLNYGRFTVTNSGNNIAINATKPLFASYSSDATQDSEPREWTPILIEFNYPLDQLAYYYAPDEEWQKLEDNADLGAVDGNTMALWVNAKSGNRTIVIGPASNIQASNGGAANASTPTPSANMPKQNLTINLTVNKYAGTEVEDAELLTVKATEPAADGKTTLTVTPESQAGVTYKYLASTTQKNPAVRIGYEAPNNLEAIPDGGEITLGSNAQAAAAQGTYFIHVYAVKEVGQKSVVAGYGVAVVTVPAAPTSAPTTLNAIKTEAKADEVQDETKTDDKKDDITIGSSETAETDEKE